MRIGPPDLERAPGVPHLRDLVDSEQARALGDLVESGFTLGWPLFTPPGVPQGRVVVLREAFARLVEDPEFARMALSSLHIELDPIQGDELTRYVEQALSTPQPLIDEAIRLLGL